MVAQRTPHSRARQASRPSPAERFLQEHENTTETLKERGVGSDGEAQNFTHIGAKMVVLYFPTTWGWESREVPSTNIRLCMRNGARYDCGDCHGDCSPDPMNPQYNNCLGREKFATRQCPVCGKLVYDFGARSVNADLIMTADINPSRVADADGTLIDDRSYESATPALRTKADMDRHIVAYHHEYAMSIGLDLRVIGPSLPGT